jgi:hypothetical protein
MLAHAQIEKMLSDAGAKLRSLVSIAKPQLRIRSS